jgi:protease I
MFAASPKRRLLQTTLSPPTPLSFLRGRVTRHISGRDHNRRLGEIDGMSRIAVMIDDLFEDVEYTKPVEAFRNEGHEIVHIGKEAGKTVRGKKEQTPVTIDQAARDADAGDFDALFIPGGYSPDKLRAHEEPVDFVRKFVQAGKPVFAICHAPQLLITARVAEGRRMTGYKSIIQDIKNAGAEFVDQDVVVDGNLVSSRNPADIPAFIDASLQKLKEASGEKARAAAARPV